MSNDEQILRYIDAAIEAKLDKMRLKVTELSGRGGDTVISSRGDIYLQPGEGRKAKYKGIEIGSGSGGVTSIFGRTGVVTYNDADYPNYLLLNGTREMTGNLDHGLYKSTYDAGGGLSGEIFGTSVSVEGSHFTGLQLVPKNTIGTSPGAIYIGDYNAKPATRGILITSDELQIQSVVGTNVSLFGGTTRVIDIAAGVVDIYKAIDMNSQDILNVNDVVPHDSGYSQLGYSGKYWLSVYSLYLYLASDKYFYASGNDVILQLPAGGSLKIYVG